VKEDACGKPIGEPWRGERQGSGRQKARVPAVKKNTALGGSGKKRGQRKRELTRERPPERKGEGEEGTRRVPKRIGKKEAREQGRKIQGPL